jgi:WhiB family transcriptional regulator, redox-sensing transcriptional regulator
MPDLTRLPLRIADSYEWQAAAACRAADPHLFFHPEGDRGPARNKREAAALAICATCPVIQPCRRHGLNVREEHGVWGGLTENDRSAMRRRGLNPAAAVRAVQAVQTAAQA